MSKIFHQLRFDPSVRVIVLASESEKIWTAGLDGMCYRCASTIYLLKLGELSLACAKWPAKVTP